MYTRSLLLLLLANAAYYVRADYPAFLNSSEYLNGTYGYYPTQTYITEPDFITPVGNMLVPPQEGVANFKHFLWAPGGPTMFIPVTGPMIIDAATLNTVWQGPIYDHETIGLAVQECNAEQYLTWWSGVGWANGKGGRSFITNNKYELKHNISAMGDLRHADCHELFLTPQCTAIITVYDPRSYDLTAFNITDGWLLDSYFQEIDLATGSLIFQWRASDFVDIMDSVWSPESKHSGHIEWHAYDYFHINSVQKDARGNYLVSARHTNSIYYISGINGHIIWTLGGPKNKFRDVSDGRATDFSWQHHVRWTNAEMTRISLFDDRNAAYYHSKRPVSRGMVVELDFTQHTARLVHEWDALHDIKSEREGSMQLLPNGNALIGYGEEPAMTEFSPDGSVLWDVTFGPLGSNRRTADNYRITKTNWTGAPTQPPKIALGPPADYTFDKKTSMFKIRELTPHGHRIKPDTVYMSWNGATEAVTWVLLASNKTQQPTVADDYRATIPKAGFESHAAPSTVRGARYAQVLALNAAQRVIGASAVLDLTTGTTTASRVGVSQFDSDFAAARLERGRGALRGLREKWGQVATHVVGKADAHRVAGVVGLVVGAALAGLLSWVLVRCRRRRAKGYRRAETDDGPGEAGFGPGSAGRQGSSNKYLDIDLRSLSSSHSQASSCLSEDLKKHDGGLLVARPGTSGG